MLSQSSRAFGATAGSARPEPDELGHGIVDHPGGEIMGEEVGDIFVFDFALLKTVERKKTEKILAKIEANKAE